MSLAFYWVLLTTISASAQDTNTYLRIKNGSLFPFKDVAVYGKPFENLKAGEFSSYQLFNGAYRYASVILVAGTNSLKLQPVDYMGENRLGPGRFTYALTVETNYQLAVVKHEDPEPPPDTIVKKLFRSRDEGPKVRVTNGTGLDLQELRLPAQPLGPIKAGETSSYFDQASPYLPGEIEIVFEGLPGRERLGTWERNHMRWNRSGVITQTFGGWFTYTLNIQSNLFLNLSLVHDPP